VGTLTVFMLPRVAQADLIFSNFSPALGNGFDTGISWGIDGILGDFQTIGGIFTASQSYTLTSFDVAGYHNTGTNAYNFSIIEDNAGLPTGNTIFSLLGASMTSVDILNPTIDTFSASGALQAGSTYWLVMESGTDDTSGGWNFNRIGQVGGMGIDNGTGMTVTASQTPAFRVNGISATPEPGSLALFLLGGIGVERLFRVRRNGWSAPQKNCTTEQVILSMKM
jgi:hypothetical protein